jgi:hypothetical protein
MKPESLISNMLVIERFPDHEGAAEVRKSYLDMAPELLELWKAAAIYMRLNRMINNNIARATSDALAHKAKWDAEVAMVAALKALEDK